MLLIGDNTVTGVQLKKKNRAQYHVPMHWFDINKSLPVFFLPIIDNVAY